MGLEMAKLGVWGLIPSRGRIRELFKVIKIGWFEVILLI